MSKPMWVKMTQPHDRRLSKSSVQALRPGHVIQMPSDEGKKLIADNKAVATTAPAKEQKGG